MAGCWNPIYHNYNNSAINIIYIYLFQQDKTPRSRVTVAKGMHIYNVGRSYYIAILKDRRPIYTTDDQVSVCHTDANSGYYPNVRLKSIGKPRNFVLTCNFLMSETKNFTDCLYSFELCNWHVCWECTIFSHCFVCVIALCS